MFSQHPTEDFDWPLILSVTLSYNELEMNQPAKGTGGIDFVSRRKEHKEKFLFLTFRLDTKSYKRVKTRRWEPAARSRKEKKIYSSSGFCETKRKRLS